MQLNEESINEEDDSCIEDNGTEQTMKTIPGTGKIGMKRMEIKMNEKWEMGKVKGKKMWDTLEKLLSDT